MRFYALVDVEHQEGGDRALFKAAEAEQALSEILGDDPEREGLFVARPVELVTGSLN